MESEYSKSVIDEFDKTFKKTWLDNLNWSSAKKAFLNGMQMIDAFRMFQVVQYSKLLLSGDYLKNETHTLEKLYEKTNDFLEDILPRRTLKVKLALEFQAMLKCMTDIIRLVRVCIKQSIKRFEPNKLVISGNFLSYSESRHRLLEIMKLVCSSCEVEYNFSYDESYIKRLLLLRQYVSDAKKKEENTELLTILNAVYCKIELLLGKLSAFSENKRIAYYHDLNLETIQLDNPDSYPQDDFRSLFQKYLDPSTLDSDVILKWQSNSLQQNIAMWQLAFLMRYYTKVTKNIEQIDKLIELTDYHNEDSIKKGNDNIVNNCARRSFLNYMYNSRFSFLCKYGHDYTYDLMKKDLLKIEAIQSETFINNYHPYQTAVNFTIKIIKCKLANYEVYQDVYSLVEDLKIYFQKYKERVAWCKQYQPYLVQLRYNFSCITLEKCDFKTFYPSSFCRPLKFKELDEKTFEYASEIAHLDYEARNQENRKLLLNAKSKIDNMEHKNMEHMGVFITLTTFLVGLLSIFIGNNGGVSIFEKMEYVIALGLILIVFISLGYFVVSEKYSAIKAVIFALLLLLGILSLVGICWGFMNGSVI